MVNPFKTNFWPRPRDEASAFVITTPLEHVGATVVTAMTVWNGVLYYAIAQAAGLPRLFRWDGINAAVEVTLPLWPGAPASIEINCMTVYDDTLWIGTSPNTGDANNIEVWFFDGNLWTDATTLAGWAAVASPVPGAIGYGVGWLFVFNSMIFVGQDTAVPAITVQQWNGTTWTNETAVLTAALAGAVIACDTPTTRMHAPVLNSTVYVGGYDAAAAGTSNSSVLSRTAAGVWAVAYNFPSSLGAGAGPADPVRAVVRINSDIFAAQGWRSRIGALTPVASGDQMKLARVTNAQYARIIPPGYLSARTVSSGRDTRSNVGVEVGIFAGPGGVDVFDPVNGSVEQVTDLQDDAPYDVLSFLDTIYLSQGSDRMRPSATPAQHSARVGHLD
jgi:hypothetical protein